MSRFYEIIFIVLIVLLFIVILSGCSMFKSQKSKSPVFTKPPTPGVQLWQAAKKSNWLVTLSVLGMAGGVFALANGSTKLGYSCIAASGVNLFMALAVARYSAWMAVFGLIGSVSAVLFSILVRRKALVEIIKGVQILKKPPHVPGQIQPNVILGDLQSKTTKTIVGNIKNELRLKGKL